MGINSEGSPLCKSVIQGQVNGVRSSLITKFSVGILVAMMKTIMFSDVL
jgi:hypothetical protein